MCDCKRRLSLPGQSHTLLQVQRMILSLMPLLSQASCRLLSARWSCVCEDGYVGNGLVCYGTVEQVRPFAQVQSFTLRPSDSGFFFRSCWFCRKPPTSSDGPP